MPDDQTATTSDPAAATIAGSLVAVIVPPELRAKEPELIELIMKSESMNNEERQYWVDILPVMTPDQVAQLRQILVNERAQLAAIDAKYAKEANQAGAIENIQTTRQRHDRRLEHSAKEEAVRSTEEREAEKILKEME